MKHKLLQKNISNKRGFTIMETLVAILILLLAVTGPMSFAQSGLRASFLARDQITAFFLAQDAIEYIKNIRDGKVIDIIYNGGVPDDWLNDFNICMDQAGCTVNTLDDPSNGISSCASINTPGCSDSGNITSYTPLNLINNVFTPDSGDPSLFSRHVYIEEIEPGVEAEVTVRIRWKSNESVGVREIVVKENIFNWANALNQ